MTPPQAEGRRMHQARKDQVMQNERHNVTRWSISWSFIAPFARATHVQGFFLSLSTPPLSFVLNVSRVHETKSLRDETFKNTKCFYFFYFTPTRAGFFPSSLKPLWILTPGSDFTLGCKFNLRATSICFYLNVRDAIKAHTDGKLPPRLSSSFPFFFLCTFIFVPLIDLDVVFSLY